MFMHIIFPLLKSAPGRAGAFGAAAPGAVEAAPGPGPGAVLVEAPAAPVAPGRLNAVTPTHAVSIITNYS